MAQRRGSFLVLGSLLLVVGFALLRTPQVQEDDEDDYSKMLFT